MLNLDQIREKYPANAKLSDDKLVSKLYNTYGNGGNEVEFYKQFNVKPPVQTQKIWEDITGGLPRAIRLAGHVIQETPKAVGNLLEASQAYDKEFHGKGLKGPVRLAQNLAGGAIEGFTDLRHLPEMAGNYAESRGLIKENKAKNLFDKTDWGEWIKPEDQNDFDKTFQSLGNFLPIMKAANIIGKGMKPLEKLAEKAGKVDKVKHVAKEAGRDVVQYGIPMAVDAAAHGEDPFAALLMPGVARSAFAGGKAIKENVGVPFKEQRAAAKQSKVLSEKITEKQRESNRHSEGEKILQGAEKKFQEERDRAKSAFGHKIGEERGKAQETLETTGGYLEGQRAAPRVDAKEGVVKSIQEEHAKIIEEKEANYKPFNEGEEAGGTQVPEEYQTSRSRRKILSDTTTLPSLEKATRKVDLWNDWGEASLETGTLDQKGNKMYYEMKRNGFKNATDKQRADYAELTRKYKEAKARDDSLKKEWDKTPEPTASDWYDVYKDSRNEAHNVFEQLKNKDLTSQERKHLGAKKKALYNVQKEAREKLRVTLSPKHFADFEAANVHYGKYVAPFKSSAFLRSIINGEGAVPISNIHNKLSGEKARRLLERLYKNQKVKSKIVSHDLKTVNINEPGALSDFLNEHAKGLDNKVKTKLQERIEALNKEKELASLESAMGKTEAKLMAQSPHIAKLMEKNPGLKESFGEIGKNQKTMDLIRKQMTEAGIRKDIIDREINAMTENMEDLKANADKWEAKKAAVKKLSARAGQAVATGTAFASVLKLFGG